ncbi:hypothetical protein BN873_360063 [Candidatus Competibacter denitrificans Run_A_D11]|uniref:Uncharacterized protein n=1 Tax=Candidatus Competibacter denitrificans Run_A_D11 TaxID=1400863 RepID=W6M8J4_9GAMM|nr:hypothetical protein BN873_360063 [Candidatus Competibacter denitrificans Run_A_D11]
MLAAYAEVGQSGGNRAGAGEIVQTIEVTDGKRTVTAKPEPSAGESRSMRAP